MKSIQILLVSLLAAFSGSARSEDPPNAEKSGPRKEGLAPDAIEEVSSVEQDSMEDFFREALFAEEVDRNLGKARRDYTEVLRQYEASQEIAATATFRLAEVYRKLASTQPSAQKLHLEKAARHYERVILDFPKMGALKKLSRAALRDMGRKPPASAGEPGVRTAEEDRTSDGITIHVRKSGGAILGGREYTEEQLLARLRAISEDNQDQAVILRVDSDVAYEHVTSVLSMIGEAGIWNIAFVAAISESAGNRTGSETEIIRQLKKWRETSSDKLAEPPTPPSR